MCSVFLYVYYDDNEYCYYFSALINDMYFRLTPADDLRELFEELEKDNYNDSDIKWCIFTDSNGKEWDYEKAFQEHGHNVIHNISVSAEELQDIVKCNFSNLIYVSENENIYDKIRILNSGNHNNEPEPSEPDILIDKTKVILNSPQKSKLAEIIEELYNDIK